MSQIYNLFIYIKFSRNVIIIIKNYKYVIIIICYKNNIINIFYN